MLVYCYKPYGIPLQTDFPISDLIPLPRPIEGKDKIISLRRRSFRFNISSKGWLWSEGFLYWGNPDSPFIFVWSPLAGSFRISLPKRQIDWDPPHNDFQFTWPMLDGWLLGTLIPQLKRALPLHAVSVVIGKKGVGFLGLQGQGKSTLAASLLKEGFPILADDLSLTSRKSDGFAIEPGFPEIRLWRQTAEILDLSRFESTPMFAGMDKKRFALPAEDRSSFYSRPASLRVLYLLSRQEGGPFRLKTLKSSEAMALLCQYNFSRFNPNPRILRQQFELASQLVSRVPVKHLFYPSGFCHLPRVRALILEDLN